MCVLIGLLIYSSTKDSLQILTAFSIAFGNTETYIARWLSFVSGCWY